MTGKGKASEKTISELKSLFPIKGGLLLYPWPNGKDDTIFTPITRPAYQRILAMIAVGKEAGKPVSVEDVHEKIFDECVKWPQFTIEERENLPVGVVHQMAKVIQEKSGLLDVDIMNRPLAPDYRTQVLVPSPSWGSYTDEELAELKKQTKFSLTEVVIDNLVFIIRPITRVDLRISQQAVDDQIALVSCVTMWPQNVPWGELPAGCLEALGRAATECSGWSSTPEITEL